MSLFEEHFEVEQTSKKFEKVTRLQCKLSEAAYELRPRVVAIKTTYANISLASYSPLIYNNKFCKAMQNDGYTTLCTKLSIALKRWI